jgi:hypothetical protein
MNEVVLEGDFLYYSAAKTSADFRQGRIRLRRKFNGLINLNSACGRGWLFLNANSTCPIFYVCLYP